MFLLPSNLLIRRRSRYQSHPLRCKLMILICNYQFEEPYTETSYLRDRSAESTRQGITRKNLAPPIPISIRLNLQHTKGQLHLLHQAVP